MVLNNWKMTFPKVCKEIRIFHWISLQGVSLDDIKSVFVLKKIQNYCWRTSGGSFMILNLLLSNITVKKQSPHEIVFFSPSLISSGRFFKENLWETYLRFLFTILLQQNIKMDGCGPQKVTTSIWYSSNPIFLKKLNINVRKKFRTKFFMNTYQIGVRP